MRALVPLLLMAATLAGCATTRTAATDPRDPYERWNRGVYSFNRAADQAVIKPATKVYRAVTPVPARRGLSRVIANLFEPINFLNNLLQGKPKRAFNSLGRFVVNTTIGVGGLADHATKMGLPPTNEDYGQTLAVYGARKSPYLVLPVLGPSTVRDAAGQVLTFLTNPVNIAVDQAGAGSTEKIAASAVQLLDTRSQIIDSGADALIETSADPYAALRSAYLQRREAQIADQEGSGATLKPEQEQDLLDKALEDGGIGTGPAGPANPSPPPPQTPAAPGAATAPPAPTRTPTPTPTPTAEPGGGGGGPPVSAPRLYAEPVLDWDAMN